MSSLRTPKLRRQKRPGNLTDIAFVDLKLDGKVKRILLGPWQSRDVEPRFQWVIGQYIAKSKKRVGVEGATF